MSKIVGFVNQKGGVGKSFTSKVAANALSGKQYNKRILLIDCDEQATSVGMRKRDMEILKGEGKDLEFTYAIATCLSADLPAVLAGKKTLQVITENEPISCEYDDSSYDYTFIDMPGRGQSSDIFALLASLDYAVIVVKGDDSETLSTLDFLKIIDRSQKLRASHNIDPLKLALMYNEFENTSIYQNTVIFWEKIKVKYGILKEILFLSSKETYKKYNNTYSNMLHELRSNKSLDGVYKEFNSFITKLLNFLES
jgi:cellulose biosynthesis protein BcsQ